MKPAAKIKCNSRQSVMRIISLCFQLDNQCGLVGASVLVRVSQPMDIAPSRHVEGTVQTEFNVHDVNEAFMEHFPLVGFAIAVRVRENKDAVSRRTIVAFGAKMSVAFRDENSAIASDS